MLFSILNLAAIMLSKLANVNLGKIGSTLGVLPLVLPNH